jgi:hypothetical protein
VKKVIDYCIVSGSMMAPDDLAHSEREKIANGWQPIGGVATGINGTLLLQAMVQHESETPSS